MRGQRIGLIVRSAFAYLGEELFEARLGRRDVLCEQLQPGRRGKAVGDNEGAKVEKFRWDDGRLLR